MFQLNINFVSIGILAILLETMKRLSFIRILIRVRNTVRKRPDMQK